MASMLSSFVNTEHISEICKIDVIYELEDTPYMWQLIGKAQQFYSSLIIPTSKGFRVNLMRNIYYFELSRNSLQVSVTFGHTADLIFNTKYYLSHFFLSLKHTQEDRNRVKYKNITFYGSLLLNAFELDLRKIYNSLRTRETDCRILYDPSIFKGITIKYDDGSAFILYSCGHFRIFNCENSCVLMVRLGEYNNYYSYTKLVHIR